MNRFFAEIDKATARKQLEFDQQRRKEFLHLVRIAFYNTIVMFLWAFSLHIFAACLPLAIVPFIYAVTYFVAQDILGASWSILWVTIRTIISKDSPLRREATLLEKTLEQAHQEWNAFKMSAFKRLSNMREVVRRGHFKEALDTEMEYFGFLSSVWAYLPPTLSRLLFDDESTARFMDSVDFDWGVLHN
ncbi:uncharacterized protein QC761_0016770 [Podospora bellae-mahoneyi]|uniref:Uncharacterized protein n=1 Tax=Podospora bellae-mahoneyi TaxID=2093777 RepID=A0ABR0FZW1_9PEZI|nr:hypothetical protein QC761_0016770 [Podospora bellae-mahoneyi]